MIRRLALIALLTLALLAPTAAHGASAWRNVTGDTHSGLVAVSVARSVKSKALHVVWAGPGTDPNTRNVLYIRDILASGALGAQRTITLGTGAGGLTNPSIARNPVDGAFWVFNAGSSTLEGRLFATKSMDDGVTWSAPNAISTSTSAYAPDSSSAAFATNGSAFQAFGVTFKRGLGVDPAEDDLSNAPGVDAGFANGCCAAWSQVAVDGLTAQPYVAWYSNVRPGRYGIEVIAPNDGTVTYAPGSANAARTNSANGDQPTPLVSRIDGGGIFLGYCGGYPACATALVWKHGAAKPALVGTGAGMQHVRVAAAPGGKLWAYWEHKGHLFARRSNASVTTWGAPVKLKLPGAAPITRRLAGDGSAAGFLDVLATISSGKLQATWSNRVLPGLTLTGPATAKLGSKITFQVTDAGAAVPAAKVVFRGTTATSNAQGKVSFTVSGSAAKVVPTVAKLGYAPGSTKIRVS